MTRKYIIPAVRQPRPDDKLGKHRDLIMFMRAEGHSFRAIAERISTLMGVKDYVTGVAVFMRVHRWSGRLKPNKRIDWDKVAA